MSFIRQVSNGDYYVCRGLLGGRSKHYKIEHTVRAISDTGTGVTLDIVSMPRGWMGKKVMFKVEVVDETNEVTVMEDKWKVKCKRCGTEFTTARLFKKLCGNCDKRLKGNRARMFDDEPKQATDDTTTKEMYS